MLTINSLNYSLWLRVTLTEVVNIESKLMEKANILFFNQQPGYLAVGDQHIDKFSV